MDLVVLCGLPASGKSTYAKKYIESNSNFVLISSDSIREELYGSESIQGKANDVFDLLYIRAKENINNGHNVLIDATNISGKHRKSLVDYIKRNTEDTYFKCIVSATTYEECIRRDSGRDRCVGENVIKKMYHNFEPPNKYYEGWDYVDIYYVDYNSNYSFTNIMNRINKISQDNPHHTLTIGQHCAKTAANIKYEGNRKYLVLLASALHDIGKEKTKVFHNMKGERSDIAHYYNHNNVGAYDSLFVLMGISDTLLSSLYLYLSADDILYIINLICWHMQPFFMETDKSINRFIGKFGKSFHDDIMKIHEADIGAK